MSYGEFIRCPRCDLGWVFQDAAGGFECTECDQSFEIQREHPRGYAGRRRQGRLGAVERLRAYVARFIEPRP